MPLIKSSSKKAFSKNVSKEMDLGKPQKQALAVAYDVQRRNRRKKMAEGGMAEMPMKDEDEIPMSADMDADSMVDRIVKKHAKDDSDDVLEGLGEDTLYASEGGLMFQDEDRSSIDQNGMIDIKAYPSLNKNILKENYNEPINEVTYPPEAPEWHEESSSESLAERIKRKMRRK